jgi:endoglucanase
MSRMASICLFLIGAVILLAGACAVLPQDEPAPPPAPAGGTPTPRPVPPIPIRRGVSLGNWLEAPAPGDWGVEIQPHHFAAIRQAGFDSVRIPARFSAHALPDPPYTLDEDFMRRVDAAVHNGLRSDLHVILDFHHYDELMGSPAAHRQRFLAIWGQLAERYASAPDTMYFELLNEPHGRLDAQAWNALLAEGVGCVRAADPTRWIIIGGADYSHIQALPTLVLPDDARLIAAFHYYEPFAFTHQGASWVDGADRWTGTGWAGSQAHKAEIAAHLDAALDWSRQHGVPLLMGEFGVIAGADADARLRWSAFLAAEAERRAIGWVYWDLCGEFRVLDCQADAWDQALLRALMPSR